MADIPERAEAAAALVRGAVRELRTDLEEVLWLLLTHTGLEASVRTVAAEVGSAPSLVSVTPCLGTEPPCAVA